MKKISKKEMVKRIYKLYRKHGKYLRFAQFIQNPFGDGDIYYVEDDVLLEILEEYYDKRTNIKESYREGC